MAAVVARRVVVHGHVQGVFFRESLRRTAERRGVSGWVANREDGTVEALLEGAVGDVDAVVAFCHHGPRGAQVGRVEVEDTQAKGLSGFDVR